MGIFTRVRDIISSNINAMLDKAEDPEKMVRLMIQEMEDTLVEVRASCAGAMAARKKTQRQLDECKTRAARWEEKAQLAVAKGRDELAREALHEKKRYRDRAASLEEEMRHCDQIVEQYQEDMRQLEDKLSSARERQRLLVQRHIRARSKKEAQERIRKVDTSDAFVRFEKFENRIERMEAEADLVNFARKPTLEDEFAKLQEDEEIEKELVALKDSVRQKAGTSQTT
ncbi:MAG: Phage shock protein A [bacterium]|nr:Phage shock protein A [bacterium]